MKTQIRFAALFLLAALLAEAQPGPSPASAAAAGKWNSEFDTPIGHLKYVYVLKVSGEKLTGTAIREREGVKTETELKEGTIQGDSISFVEPIKIQDQDVRIEYKGKLTGDQIKFSRKVGDFGTADIVARRAVEATAPITGKWTTEFDSQVGKQKYVYELNADGDKLTGKAIGDMQFGKFETPITEGKITPEVVSFVEMLKLPNFEVKILYSGKLVGDELKLTRKVGDIATEEIVAKRVIEDRQK
jgi:hypothetical protein